MTERRKDQLSTRNNISGYPVSLDTVITIISRVGLSEVQSLFLLLLAGEFDMRVKSCSAFTDNSRPIDLSDEHGCVLRPKMISKFMKIAGADTRFVLVMRAQLSTTFGLSPYHSSLQGQCRHLRFLPRLQVPRLHGCQHPL